MSMVGVVVVVVSGAGVPVGVSGVVDEERVPPEDLVSGGDWAAAVVVVLLILLLAIRVDEFRRWIPGRCCCCCWTC